MDGQIAFTHPVPHSAVQQRPPDSYGKSVQGESTLAEAAHASPMESGWPMVHVFLSCMGIMQETSIKDK
ncbi:hypothetical protein [Rossellomorea marisflavi]|uniref:hypothetical protein n=1 Tax=Rossellomorea marisflavi TaxID=189381 RepID=UPI0035689AD5